MDDFFDKIKGKVDQGISVITSKTKDALELASLRNDLRTLEEKKEEKIKELGTLAYRLLNAGELEPKKLENLHSSLKEIDGRIVGIKEKITNIQQTSAEIAPSAQDQTFAFCECGSALKETAKFCPRCGVNVQKNCRKG